MYLHHNCPGLCTFTTMPRAMYLHHNCPGLCTFTRNAQGYVSSPGMPRAMYLHHNAQGYVPSPGMPRAMYLHHNAQGYVPSPGMPRAMYLHQECPGLCTFTRNAQGVHNAGLYTELLPRGGGEAHVGVPPLGCAVAFYKIARLSKSSVPSPHNAQGMHSSMVSKGVVNWVGM